MSPISSISSAPSDPSPQPWVPAAPGDGVAGRVIEVTTVEDDWDGDPVPVVTLRTRDGRVVRVSGHPPVLRRELAQADPRPGDGIGVKFLGERPINGNPHRKAGQYRVVKKTGAA